MKVLLVEDEPKLSAALSHLLKKNGYTTDNATDGEMAIDMAATGLYDMVILDRMLPYRDGLSVLKEYRALGYKNPVIFLTALDSLEDRVEGLDCGADDYVVKPFSAEELLARMRALSRRIVPQEEPDTIMAAGIVLDPMRSEVKWMGQPLAQLTVKESMILELLMRNHGQVIPTDRILEKVWGQHSSAYRPYVHLYIHYLRKKLPQLSLQTVHEVGYCLQ
jgi:DNA-binding response OmpR family regulator